MVQTVLILGSSPDALAAVEWEASYFDRIVAINNAWQVRPDWTHLIHPEDFDQSSMPQRVRASQELVDYRSFVPALNAFGGVVYAGGTMAFTAGYWALHAFRPRVLAFFGCDMVYPATGRTHFYGKGRADPLRPDPTLQSLRAKSARLMQLAAHRGTACVNLSTSASNLVFPRCQLTDLGNVSVEPLDPGTVDAALEAEDSLDCRVASGRYWEEDITLDWKALARIDRLWLEGAGLRAGESDRRDKRQVVA